MISGEKPNKRVKLNIQCESSMLAGEDFTLDNGECLMGSEEEESKVANPEGEEIKF